VTRFPRWSISENAPPTPELDGKLLLPCKRLQVTAIAALNTASTTIAVTVKYARCMLRAFGDPPFVELMVRRSLSWAASFDRQAITGAMQ